MISQDLTTYTKHNLREKKKDSPIALQYIDSIAILRDKSSLFHRKMNRKRSRSRGNSPQRRGRPTPTIEENSSSHPEKSQEFNPGVRVFARWKGRTKWYKGTITEVKPSTPRRKVPSASVHYDDGTKEGRVPFSRLRKIETLKDGREVDFFGFEDEASQDDEIKGDNEIKGDHSPESVKSSEEDIGCDSCDKILTEEDARYRCQICADFDLCKECFTKWSKGLWKHRTTDGNGSSHPFMKVGENVIFQPPTSPRKKMGRDKEKITPKVEEKQSIKVELLSSGERNSNIDWSKRRRTRVRRIEARTKSIMDLKPKMKPLCAEESSVELVSLCHYSLIY